jgi:RNA 3'-terminal phosphate cyclase (ATP)
MRASLSTPLSIDGSFGEGGGQVLRTSLSLSLATGTPFQISKIRAGRERPGLLRQHLTAVLAAAEVGGAETEGVALGSKAITFVPQRIRAGEFRFAVGTAGSATLVLQTILPALLTAAEPSTITIDGGTHNQAAPPFSFLYKTFAPIISTMGPSIDLRLERYGFYPAGGGRIVARITPARALTPFHLQERGEITHRRVVALVANLPENIAEREMHTAIGLLNWTRDAGVVESTTNSPGPGNIVMVEVGSAQVREVFSSFGQIGITAEKVATDAAREAQGYLVSRAAAGEHLTDQLLLPMALAGGGSFTAQKLNLHARTNMSVIEQFLPVKFETKKDDDFTRVSL